MRLSQGAFSDAGHLGDVSDRPSPLEFRGGVNWLGPDDGCAPPLPVGGVEQHPV
jgi:hypothetical protein